MLSLLVLSVLGVLGTSAQTSDYDVGNSMGMGLDLCNPVVAECDGKWQCSNMTSVPVYHPRYGMICQIEDGAESFSVGMTEMCPFGGSLGSDFLCTVLRPVSSQCPDFTETVRDSTTTYIQCIYKYPPFCPGGFVFLREVRGCVRFEKARCFNETGCNEYYCPDGAQPIYLGLGSDERPMCKMSEYDPVPSSTGQVNCPYGGELMGTQCVIYRDAFYRDCDEYASATPKPEPTREAPSKSAEPEPSREAPSQSSKPEPSREAPSQSSKPEPSREEPSKSPEPSREAPSQSSKPEPSREEPSKSPEPSREAPSQSSKPEPSREEPSKSPEPSREAPSQSSKPEPSREEPSKSPEPSREPCPHPHCPFPMKLAADGMCYDRQPMGGHPYCGDISNTYLAEYEQCAEWTMEGGFSDAAGCPTGFQYITIQGRQVCVRLYNPQWLQCPPEYYPQIGEETEFCEKRAHPKCVCPPVGNYTACLTPKDRYEIEDGMGVCYTWFEFTNDMTHCPPEYFVVPRNDTLYCVKKYEPVWSNCPQGYIVAVRLDGTEVCQPIQGERCDQSAVFESSPSPSSTSKPAEPSREPVSASPSSEPSREAPSNSPEPSREVPSKSPEPSREVPSQSPEPSREAPSKSPEPSRERPSETPSATPVTVPVITATIRIEVSTSIMQNTTSDLSVFQEPAVLMSLKDAIARALGVPVDMVVIESVAWVDNGVVMSTVQIYNMTSGGRRLQTADGFDIKYKVVNPPEELIRLAPEDFATKVEASTSVLSAAAGAVSAAMGVQVTANDIAVQSTEMAMLTPQTAPGSNNQATSLPMGTIVGGAGGGLVVLGSIVGIAVAMYYKKKRISKVNPAKTVLPSVVSFPAENNFRTDRISIINPLRPGVDPEQTFVVHNKNFSMGYSSRDIEGAFKPRQARRS